MKRTTISLPDGLASALEREARRSGMSASQIVREALEARLGPAGRASALRSIVGLGRSGYTDTSERMEEILREAWGNPNFDRDR